MEKVIRLGSQVKESTGLNAQTTQVQNGRSACTSLLLLQLVHKTSVYFHSYSMIQVMPLQTSILELYHTICSLFSCFLAVSRSSISFGPVHCGMAVSSSLKHEKLSKSVGGLTPLSSRRWALFQCEHAAEPC